MSILHGFDMWVTNPTHQGHLWGVNPNTGVPYPVINYGVPSPTGTNDTVSSPGGTNDTVSSPKDTTTTTCSNCPVMVEVPKTYLGNSPLCQSCKAVRNQKRTQRLQRKQRRRPAATAATAALQLSC